MFADPALVALYAVPLALALWAWGCHQHRRSARNRALLAANRGAGLAEPPGLHPLIDPARCIGCGACVRACPETDALGLIGRMATLVEPAACIGHGTCQSACPTAAIALVYGSTAHGYAMPVLGPACETSVPGIHAVGELAGAGLIARAMEQAVAVVDHIAVQGDARSADPAVLDLVIVGCGPAGLAGALAARAHGLNFAVIEQDSLGGAVAHYPRGKRIHAATMQLPILGTVALDALDKDALIGFWRHALEAAAIMPRFGEAVLTIARASHALCVTTDSATFHAQRVMLATGRGGTPRRLGVAGEELPKVAYRLGDPAHYAGQDVLVAGGGDSALEAVTALADVPGTRVTLVHRGDTFPRAKPENLAMIEALEHGGRITVARKTEVIAIARDSVCLRSEGAIRTRANDAVVACLGGMLAQVWLDTIGIATVTRHGQPAIDRI